MDLTIALDNLYQIIKQSDLLTIKRLCATNQQISNYCRQNSQISNLISQKRHEIRFRTKALLDKYKSIVNPYEADMFNSAISDNDLEVVDELILSGYDPHFVKVDRYIGSTPPIIYASSLGYLDIVSRLLQDSQIASYSPNLGQAIIEASENGHLSVVQRLLKEPLVNPSIKNNLAIKRASEKGYLEIVDLLLSDIRVWSSLANFQREKFLRQIDRPFPQVPIHSQTVKDESTKITHLPSDILNTICEYLDEPEFHNLIVSNSQIYQGCQRQRARNLYIYVHDTLNSFYNSDLDSDEKENILRYVNSVSQVPPEIFYYLLLHGYNDFAEKVLQERKVDLNDSQLIHRVLNVDYGAGDEITAQVMNLIASYPGILLKNRRIFERLFLNSYINCDYDRQNPIRKERFAEFVQYHYDFDPEMIEDILDQLTNEDEGLVELLGPDLPYFEELYVKHVGKPIKGYWYYKDDEEN